MSRRSGSQKNAPDIVNATAMASMESTAVDMADFIRSKSFCAKSCEITTEQPVLAPVATAKNNTVMG